MSRSSCNSKLIPFDPEPERTFHRRRNFLKEVFEIAELIMPKLSTHSMPQVAAIPKGFEMPTTVPANFEIKAAFLNLIERNQFGGSAIECPNRHIQIFCDYCSTIKQTGITQSQIREMLFPFSLRDNARQWITDLNKEALGIDSWENLALAFIEKYYPPEKTAMLRSQITSFRQTATESFFETWERYKKLIRECPHHGLSEWFVIMQFYNGLYEESRAILDSAANGRFANNVDDDKAWGMIEEMAIHSQQYGKPRGNSNRANNDIDTASSLSAQIAALTTKIDQLSGVNSHPQIVNAIEHQSGVNCGACGTLGHTSNECRSGQEQVHAFQSYQQNSPYSGTYNENTRNHPNFSWKSNNVLNPPIQQQQATFQKSFQPPGFQRPPYTPPQPTHDMSRLEALMTQSMASQATFQQQSLAAQASFQQQTQATLKTHDEKLQQLMMHTKLMDTQIAQLAASNPTRQQGLLPTN